MSTLLKVTCLCGRCKDTLEIPSALPINSITCSCDICRYCTGVLFVTTLPLNGQPNLVSHLSAYRSSKVLTRYFCGDCGSHVCVKQDNGTWSLCAGVVDEIVGLQKPPDQVQVFTQHEFVGSTLDGGLAVCLAEWKGKPIPLYLQGPNEKAFFASPTDNTGNSSPDQARSETLRASCHCGGVSYHLTPPNDASKQCSSPWTDLIVPHSAHSDNTEDVKWWLCKGNTKYYAGTCGCRSCRIGCGSPIQTWAFVPEVNIKKSDGSALDYEMGTLKQYTSSSGTYREFCGVCGATVFWHCEARPELIDVSVGLLRAAEGSRAERWLEWNTTRVSFKEHAFDQALVSEIEAGLQTLRVQS